MNTKSLVVTFGLLCLSISVSAQQAPIQKAFWTDPFNHPMLSAYVTIGLLIISVLAAFGAAVAIGKAMRAIVPDVKIKNARTVAEKKVDDHQLQQTTSESSSCSLGKVA